MTMVALATAGRRGAAGCSRGGDFLTREPESPGRRARAPGLDVQGPLEKESGLWVEAWPPPPLMLFYLRTKRNVLSTYCMQDAALDAEGWGWGGQARPRLL